MQVAAICRAFPVSQWHIWLSLAAYSCGGSHVFTVFPFPVVQSFEQFEDSRFARGIPPLRGSLYEIRSSLQEVDDRVGWLAFCNWKRRVLAARLGCVQMSVWEEGCVAGRRSTKRCVGCGSLLVRCVFSVHNKRPFSRARCALALLVHARVIHAIR